MKRFFRRLRRFHLSATLFKHDFQQLARIRFIFDNQQPHPHQQMRTIKGRAGRWG
jgi:hypothetical protein